MEEDSSFKLNYIILLGVGLIILLLVLSLPVKGSLFGYDISLPIIGWLGFLAFAVLSAMYLWKR